MQEFYLVEMYLDYVLMVIWVSMHVPIQPVQKF